MRYMLASTIMFSSLFIPAVANASAPANDATAPTANLRVSTGVKAPILTDSINVPLPDGIERNFIFAGTEVGLSLKIDSNGKAEDVKVVKPSNPLWDARVVAAVQKAHFHPGTIDNQAIPMDVNLTVDIAQ